MNKKFYFALLLALCVLACKSDPIVGTWTSTDPNSGSRLATLTFRGDKTFYGDSEDRGNGSVVAGYYEVKGTEVNLGLTSNDGGHPASGTRQPASATLSEDGKTLSYKGSTFTRD